MKTEFKIRNGVDLSSESQKKVNKRLTFKNKALISDKPFNELTEVFI